MVSKVAGTAKEARKEVEWIVVLPGPAAALVLFDTVVSVLVIYLSGFTIAQDLVGFSHLDELLVC
jgi:hypothetical protein